MEKPEVRRVYRQFTPEERERWQNARADVETEWPDMQARHRQLREAASELTLSGALRRAVHRAGLLIPLIARQVGIPETDLHEFLLGERTLRSDVLDRLAKVLAFELPDNPAAASSMSNRAAPGISAPVPPLDSSSATTTS
jgi:hypothetical protein